MGGILVKHADACERSSPFNASVSLKLANSNTVMCSDFVHLELLGKSKMKVCIRLK